MPEPQWFAPVPRSRRWYSSNCSIRRSAASSTSSGPFAGPTDSRSLSLSRAERTARSSVSGRGPEPGGGGSELSRLRSAVGFFDIVFTHLSRQPFKPGGADGCKDPIAGPSLRTSPCHYKCIDRELTSSKSAWCGPDALPREDCWRRSDDPIRCLIHDIVDGFFLPRRSGGSILFASDRTVDVARDSDPHRKDPSKDPSGDLPIVFGRPSLDPR